MALDKLGDMLKLTRAKSQIGGSVDSSALTEDKYSNVQI